VPWGLSDEERAEWFQATLRDNPVRVMTRAGMAPDPWQQRVLGTTMEQVLLLCSRQVGKSTVAAALAIRAAILQAEALVLVLSPSLRQSGELFRKVLGHFNALGRPLPVTNESALRIEFANGSRVVSLPGDEGTNPPIALACGPTTSCSRGKLSHHQLWPRQFRGWLKRRPPGGPLSRH
jgi:hypothetical protein